MMQGGQGMQRDINTQIPNLHTATYKNNQSNNLSQNEELNSARFQNDFSSPPLSVKQDVSSIKSPTTPLPDGLIITKMTPQAKTRYNNLMMTTNPAAAAAA